MINATIGWTIGGRHSWFSYNIISQNEATFYRVDPENSLSLSFGGQWNAYRRSLNSPLAHFADLNFHPLERWSNFENITAPGLPFAPIGPFLPGAPRTFDGLPFIPGEPFWSGVFRKVFERFWSSPDPSIPASPSALWRPPRLKSGKLGEEKPNTYRSRCLQESPLCLAFQADPEFGGILDETAKTPYLQSHFACRPNRTYLAVFSWGSWNWIHEWIYLEKKCITCSPIFPWRPGTPE